MSERYPGITRACFLIALDNGGLNCHRPEAELRSDIATWCSAQPMDLRPIDAWLATLSDADLDTVCCGGQDEPEQVELLAKAPPFTDALLNDYFEQVC